jgi:phosphate:Na+ symporter
MLHLLNLLAAIALLVWGTHIVRTGMLRVFGENLRGVLAKSFGSRFAALLAGLGVTSLVQSSTATCLIVAVVRRQGAGAHWRRAGGDAGRRRGHRADGGGVLVRPVLAVALLIFVGVVMFISRQASTAGRVGRVLIGLGLITLALQLIVGATGR